MASLVSSHYKFWCDINFGGAEDFLYRDTTLSETETPCRISNIYTKNIYYYWFALVYLRYSKWLRVYGWANFFFSKGGWHRWLLYWMHYSNNPTSHTHLQLTFDFSFFFGVEYLTLYSLVFIPFFYYFLQRKI